MSKNRVEQKLEQQRAVLSRAFSPETTRPSSSLRSPDVPVKEFARLVTRDDGLPPAVKKAMDSFLSAQTYINLEIGDPKHHKLRADREVAKLRLSEEEVSWARDLARVQFEGFLVWISGDERVGEFSEEAMEVARKKAEAENSRVKAEEKNRTKRSLAYRFRVLMERSDWETRRLNINERGLYTNDLVFRAGNSQVKNGILKRTIQEDLYDSWMKAISEGRKKLLPAVLHIEGELFPSTIAKMEAKVEALSRDQRLRSRLGEAAHNSFIYYLEELIYGTEVDRSRILAAGLDPEEVLRKAWSIRNGAFFDSAEEKVGERLILQGRKLKIGKRLGVDLVAYEMGRRDIKMES